MALQEGTSLGTYEIMSPIGAGGMGEVYRARDNRLDRDVAIKVLPDTVTRDAERVARFDREAKLLASLNHPNIASIYGFDESEGTRFLVLEFVEGVTLSDRLNHGAMAVDEAMETAKQIAEALESAHEQGIIHRDLKPANVMIRPDGTVKVLDFGLAKAMTEEPSGSVVANSPTITANYTRPGVVLGTAAYMSPEQARGRPVDKRTDIWSFGILLFECLSGERLFQGVTANDSMGAIMHKEPNWSLLPPSTPPTVQLLLRRCLTKDRKRRLQAIGDARIEIENALIDPTSSMLNLTAAALDESGRRPRKTRSATLIGFVLGALLTAGLAWVVLGNTGTSLSGATMRLSIPIPHSGYRKEFALSPDGTKIVFVADAPYEESERSSQLWLRRLDAFEAVPMAGTRDGKFPVFSPDSTRVAFIREEGGGHCKADLVIAYLDGRPPETIYNRAIDHNFPCWLTNNELAFFDGVNKETIVRLPVRGGVSTTIGKIEDSGGFARLCSMADGAWIAIGPPGRGRAGIDVMDTGTGDVSKLISDATAPRHPEEDLLVFRRSDSLLASRISFNGDAPTLVGDLIPILPGTTIDKGWRRHHYSFSTNGHLAYSPGRDSRRTESQLSTIDGQGNIEPFPAEPRHYGVIGEFSPDGNLLSFMLRDGDDFPSPWIMELDTGSVRRISDEDSPAWGIDWLPDGRFVFSTSRDEESSLMVTEMRRNATPEPLFADGIGGETIEHQGGVDIVPDGEHFVFTGSAEGREDKGIYVRRLAEDSDNPRALLDTKADESACSISPDGKWIAFTSDESGRKEVYVMPLAASESADDVRIHRVSKTGGDQAFWSVDGSSLFFHDRRSKSLWSVDLTFTDGVIAGGDPTQFIDLEAKNLTRVFRFLPMPDGERLLFVQWPEEEDSGDETKQIHLVLNWTRELQAALQP
ncbi:MAG: protein kinase domain-containing protein [Planctomycetota bacterium]|jgi:serine/threonine protein kinase/Tol biopolymer transport system component